MAIRNIKINIDAVKAMELVITYNYSLADASRKCNNAPINTISRYLDRYNKKPKRKIVKQSKI